MFLGTIRKHKGIDDLINAIKLLDSKNVKLVLVGANFKDRYVQQLMKLSNNEITFIGEQPFDKIPEYLAVADLIAIPQKKSYSAMGQVPAKVFDAMAMAKPIISTNISDLPIILKDCGIIVEPGDINGLAEKIKFILDNPKIAKEMGKRAREKCVKEYSFEAIAPKLLKIFEKYEKVIAENQAKFKS
jgi:glycosyltransferase involved in cell wall biosynthesis